MYSRTHPITLFLKKILSRVSSNPLTITLNRVIYAPHDQCDHNTSGVYYNEYLSIISKIIPQFLNIDFYP